MKQKNQASDVEAEGTQAFDLASVIDTLVNHRVMIAVTLAVIVAMGACYAFLSSPIYQARILVKVEDNTGAAVPDSKDVVSNASLMFDEKSSAEGEMQVLGSKRIVAQAVDALKLYVSAQPHRFALIGDWIARHNDAVSKPGLFGMGGFAWGDEAIEVAGFEVPKKFEGAGYTVTALSDGQYLLEGAGLERPVTGRVAVKEQFASSHGPITLLVGKIDGEKGVEFDLTRHSRQMTIDQLQKRLKISEQGNKSSVISATLESPDPVLASATINEIGRQYVRQNADRKVVNAGKSLDYLKRQLPATKRQLEDAEDSYNAYRNSHALLDVDEEGKVILKQSADAENRLLDLKRARQDLAAHFSATHPSVMAVDGQIAATREYIENLTARVRAMPSAEQGALRLMRDVRVSTELYSALRNNIETLGLIKAGKVASVQLIDTAEVPERPVKPIKPLVLAMSVVVGLFVGIGLAFGRDFLFKGLTDPEELESNTGLSVYATIPLSERQRELSRKIAAEAPEQLVLALRYPMDPAVEGLRMMRSALQFALIEARNNVVMLAGPLPGIGKSFLAANLATLLAAGGKRVLLVDGDLRRGHLHQYFGLARGPGLVDLIAGSCLLDAVVHRSVLPHLDVLQCGAYPRDPAELLLRSSFGEVIHTASKQYDIVLLDAPAILAVSDTGIMAPVAGSIFLVARFADTRAGEIAESVKRLAQTGSKVKGVLLNGFRVHRGNYAQVRRYGGYAYDKPSTK